MNRTKRLKGICTECGSPIEFPAEMIGGTAQCLRCRKQTQLMLAPTAVEPVFSRRMVVCTIGAIVVLVVSLIVVMIGLRHYEKVAADQKRRPAAQQSGKSTNSPAPPRR